MHRSLKPLFRRARDLARDDRGNVAMLVAVSIIPLSVGALGALDLTHKLAAQVELQDALDAAALAAARSGGNDAKQLQQIGSKVLAQNLLGAKNISNVAGAFAFGANGSVVAQATGTITPMLAGMGGGGSVSAQDEVVRANNMLEIALVLDNTGSMSQSLGSGGSKISELITAATSFVDTMSTAAAKSTATNPVRISLVPFAATVNVGSTYATADWLDTGGLAPATNQIFTGNKRAAPPSTTHINRLSLFTKLGSTWGGCVEARVPDTSTNGTEWDIDDKAPNPTYPQSLFTPYFAVDEADSTAKPLPDNDYVTDPTSSSLDAWGKQGDTAKYSNKPKRTLTTSLGPNAGCGMTPLKRLTTDFAGLKTQIAGMKASGNTNIPFGLMWGWHTLSPNKPFADGVAYGTPKYKKVVVLMTDGENTLASNTDTINGSDYAGYGYVWEGHLLQANGTPLTNTSSATSALDARLTKLCTKMKDKDIEIYTIGVGVTSASKTLLTNCATDKNHYFDVTNGSSMTPTFTAIANQIAALHLSR